MARRDKALNSYQRPDPKKALILDDISILETKVETCEFRGQYNRILKTYDCLQDKTGTCPYPTYQLHKGEVAQICGAQYRIYQLQNELLKE